MTCRLPRWRGLVSEIDTEYTAAHGIRVVHVPPSDPSSVQEKAAAAKDVVSKLLPSVDARH